ncbi:MAG: prepilin-type N-terminal cleavage/methylation domain-containing protein [Pirellulales bacterium]|nr:prepilin-type N-terminal cleavage/methylation domain-containing protein [Pirellulales bacterium]
MPGIDPRPTRLPRGLTLIEVVLVLSLLVIVAAVSVPYMGGSVSRANLQAASDIVRDAWTQGRFTAMQTGETQVFRFEPNGSRFQLMPLDELTLPETALPAATHAEAEAETEHSASDYLRLKPPQLPEHVVFAAGDVAASNQVAAMLGTPSDSAWSSPILFHPDGTATDATIVLKNDLDQTIRVTLRGITGLATASDVANEVVP